MELLMKSRTRHGRVCLRFMRRRICYAAVEMEERTILDGLWNLEKYPLPDASATTPSWIMSARRALQQRNGVLLPGAVLDDGIETMKREVEAIPRSSWFRGISEYNVLLAQEIKVEGDDDGQEQRAIDALGNEKTQSQKSLIAYDQLPSNSLLRRFYVSPELLSVVKLLVSSQVENAEPLFHSADPLGAAYINIFEKNDSLGWHFDNSGFFVNLILQEPDEGGEFQYAWDMEKLKSPRFQDLLSIVQADSNSVKQFVQPVDVTKGTLMIFKGGQAMHQVTSVSSEKPRINVIFTFEKNPNKCLNPFTQMAFFGRTTS